MFLPVNVLQYNIDFFGNIVFFGNPFCVQSKGKYHTIVNAIRGK